ncbi:MAG: HAD-IC family P-type ATPase [Coriobacteriia bacterium]|nr:HAD-IC family P-type ATPase [Coriobacteriia bacterium]
MMPLQTHSTNSSTGLTTAEVQSRQQRGLDNSYVANPGKTNWDIIRSNTFTLFNVTSFIIFIAVLAVGSIINSLFMLLLVFNVTLGIVVEIRARRIVDKLTLLNTDPVIAIRDGSQHKIAPRDIVIDDLLVLNTGDQVPTDSQVISGYAEVNEALLTGESDLLIKQTNDHLLSGSFIASGQVMAIVEHVGADNYSTKLTAEAKQYRPIESGLMKALGTVMKFVSWIALPLGVILLIQALVLAHVDYQTAVLATTAGLLGMIPRGMVVLVAVTLVTGVVKLGRRQVLVQEMYSIETMAHLDTLCLDKTGTITEGVMRVASIQPLEISEGRILATSSEKAKQQAESDLRTYLAAATDMNSTMTALRDAYPVEASQHQLPAVPFSSHRKWGAIDFSPLATQLATSHGTTLVLGAPEMLLPRDEPLPAAITDMQLAGYRVLLLGTRDQLPSIDDETLTDLTPLAVIMLDDPIRESAPQTLGYLREQGVSLKIISGDNPKTVSIIAQRAGFDQHDRYVDASTLSDDQLLAVLDETAIFGRVSPQQKKLIVSTLRQRGHTVGMTGDGVNDILAMREANLSIAMATGDAATKQIANLVLLKSDFADVPEILYEARRVVNNMLRSASIFFIKTIYSLFIVLTSSVSMLAGNLFLFPFVAIQVTLADQTIGWPTFYFSFRKDRAPVQKEFLKTALMRSLPNAVLIAASFVFVHFYGQAQGWSQIDSITLMYCCLGIITFYNVLRACWPLNLHNLTILILTLGGYFLGLYFIGPHVGLASTMTAATLPVFAAITAISFVIWLIWIRLIKY